MASVSWRAGVKSAALTLSFAARHPQALFKLNSRDKPHQLEFEYDSVKSFM